MMSSLSSKKCCVPGCTDSSGMQMPLHLFPNPVKDIERFNMWVTSIGGDIVGLDNNDIYKHRRVCHVHFETRFCCRYNRLSNIAMPTLNLPGMQMPLHLFPNPVKDIERFNMWVTSIGGDIVGLDNNDIYKHRRVCHVHFETRFCCRYNRLSNIAMPTLNLPGPLSMPKFTFAERKPLQQIQNVPDEMIQNTSSKVAEPTLGGSAEMLSCEAETHVTQKITINRDVPATPKATSQSSLLSSKKPNIGPLSMPKFTFAERKPLQQIQNVPDEMIQNTSSKVAEPTLGGSAEMLSCEAETHVTQKITINRDVPATPKATSQSSLLSSKKPKIAHTARTVAKKRVTIRTKKLRMTDEENCLFSKLRTLKIKLSKCKSKLKKQAQEIKKTSKLCTNPAFVKIMENMPKSTKVLTLLQFREHGKKEKGRRFNINEKILALTILKQSPKAYRFLRKIITLPSPQILMKLLTKANVQPGVNKKIFAQLKAKATKMKKNDKLCILLYDEMSLQTNVTYNERKDRVTGFVTDGKNTQLVLANHAQVFMIRGLIKNYKEPISYTFSSGATKGLELAKQIKEIILELQEVGFQVLATVCDQGSNNRQAIKLLMNESRGTYLRRGETPKDHVFLVNNAEVVPLYDPPHLLKGIRNNLLTKHLQFEMEGKKKIAKWQHLQLLHKENPGYKGVRLVPKLTDAHVIPQKIGKMKVKFASQVFSATVASNMGYLADKGILPKECQDTADLIMFTDKLFDSVNGSHATKNRFAKPLLGPVTPQSCHHETWRAAKKILKTMSFIRAGKKECVPTVNNWVWTLEGIEVLIHKLDADYNITSVWMRHLNQDPIENFFGAIRSHGYRNTNPTPERFESAYTTLLVNSLTSVHAPGGNCENDMGETLIELVTDESYGADQDAARVTEVDIYKIFNIELEPIESKRRNPKIFAPLQYISGYFIHKAKKIFRNCVSCQNNLLSVEHLEYLRYREYAGRRWLCSPSESVIKLISNLQDITMEILKENLEKNNLKLYIKTVINILVDLKVITCENHRDILLEFLINKVTRFFIFTYCKNINKILYGQKGMDDMGDQFQNMATDIFRKSLKRKINTI